MGYDGIEKPRNPLQWMLGEIDSRMGRVLDHSFTDLARDGSKHDRGVVYAAVVTDDATVEGVVALFFEETEIVDGKATTYLMLKVMGEGEEPLMDECPAHLLGAVAEPLPLQRGGVFGADDALMAQEARLQCRNGCGLCAVNQDSERPLRGSLRTATGRTIRG
jgi:hypothetical protein